MSQERSTESHQDPALLESGIFEAERRIEHARVTAATNLNLSRLDLASLPESLRGLTSLTSLHLERNRLEELPLWLGELTSLGWLRLDQNQLTSLPESLGQLTSLTQLNLYQNSLMVLPRSLHCLIGLNWLNLDRNQLRELPEWIGDLTNLTYLNVENNQLDALPISFGNLTSLTQLYLSSNQLTELPGSFGELRSLTVFKLERNQVEVVPESLKSLVSLSHLSLHMNQLRELPKWLGDLVSMTILNVENNQITALPESLGDLIGLTRLYLSGNLLSALPETLARLSSLNWLNIDRNQFSNLPEWLWRLGRLTHLNVEENRLSSLPDSIGKISTLVHLNIGDNLISALPESLGSLAALKLLNISGNPLTYPPSEILATGSETVLAFLRASRHGSTRQWSSKILVVGEGAVGKTSLIKAMSGLTHDPGEPTTHSLSVTEMPLPHPERRDVTMLMAVWDFGGQEIYHATHQFFLTDWSIALLVWKPRAGFRQSRVRYWLDILTARAPHAPIILVASHGDDGRASDISLAGLREHYPRIVGAFIVDSSSGFGIADLLVEIGAQASALPSMGAPWPDAWMTVASGLGDATQTHITDRQMHDLMVDAGVSSRADRELLADLLQQRGVILRQEDPGPTQQIVVLAPEWLNTRISRVLNMADSVPAARTGLLTQTDLDREWADVEPAMREHLLDMMQAYDLAYRVEASNSAIVAVVAGLLPLDEPDYTALWDQAGESYGRTELRIRYDLAVLPPGIPTWFIAREHRFATGIAWRFGVVLRDRDGQHLALLRVDPERETADLLVRGPVPQGFFAVLDDGLNLLLDRYPGLEVRRRVPCPCSGPGTCTEFFNYSKLLTRLNRGRRDVECDVTGALVPILTLLAGIAPTRRETEPFSTADLDQIIERIGGGQRAILKAIQTGQQARCPSVFTVTPIDKWRLGRSVYLLRLYCEEPGAWHRLDGEEGCYEITELDSWLARYGPIARRTLSILSKAVPVAGAAVGLATQFLDGQVKDDFEHMRKLLSSKIPPDLSLLKDHDPGQRLLQGDHLNPGVRADTDSDFRVLTSMLHELDPHEHWGGLNRTVTPEGMTLYLCREHSGSYQ